MIGRFNRQMKNASTLHHRTHVIASTHEKQHQDDNTFIANKLTRSDFSTEYPNCQVTVDTDKKQLVITLQDHRLVVIPFSSISGLDFQYSPLNPVIVVIEMKELPIEAPSELQSAVYFLYCEKMDCAKYLDGIMLKADKRLHTLAIKSLPTWSVVVNRYRIPIYYSYRVRVIVTVIVNIYILISLVWGFYDLYKHLPFVGNAIQAIVKAVVEPLFKNRIILGIPLLFGVLFEYIKRGIDWIVVLVIPLFRTLWQFIRHCVKPFSGVVHSVKMFLEIFYHSIIEPLRFMLGGFGIMILESLKYLGSRMSHYLRIAKTLFQPVTLMIYNLTTFIGNLSKSLIDYVSLFGNAFVKIVRGIALATKLIVTPFMNLMYLLGQWTYHLVQGVTIIIRLLIRPFALLAELIGAWAWNIVEFAVVISNHVITPLWTIWNQIGTSFMAFVQFTVEVLLKTFRPIMLAINEFGGTIKDQLVNLVGLMQKIWEFCKLFTFEFLDLPLKFLRILFQFLYNLFSAIRLLATQLSSTVAVPITKLKPVFRFGSNVVQVGQKSHQQAGKFRQFLNHLQLNFQPLNGVWSGIQKIINVTNYLYQTKVKHKSRYQRITLLITYGSFIAIIIALIIYLIFFL